MWYRRQHRCEIREEDKSPRNVITVFCCRVRRSERTIFVNDDPRLLFDSLSDTNTKRILRRNRYVVFVCVSSRKITAFVNRPSGFLSGSRGKTTLAVARRRNPPSTTPSNPDPTRATCSFLETVRVAVYHLSTISLNVPHDKHGILQWNVYSIILIADDTAFHGIPYAQHVRYFFATLVRRFRICFFNNNTIPSYER